MAPRHGRTPVALFGCGTWATKHWIPELVQLSRWNVIDLTLIDKWKSRDCPDEITVLQRNGIIRYLDWETFSTCEHPPQWKIAYVVTSPSAHYYVIKSLLQKVPALRVIVCEKPCGDSIKQAFEIYKACPHHGVTILIADHYLLRPGLQYLLYDPAVLNSIGTPTEVIALINEAGKGGPRQSVIADLVVHLLDILLILFPESHFLVDDAYTAQISEEEKSYPETFVLVIGRLILQDGSQVRCHIQGGKRLSNDNKSIKFIGPKGQLQLDLIENSLTLKLVSGEEVHLKWEPEWSYGKLILKSLSLI